VYSLGYAPRLLKIIMGVFIVNNNIQVIEVTPDKNGKVFITLYGTKYEIKVKEPKPSKTKDKE
jgi:hypothetical protein